MIIDPGVIIPLFSQKRSDVAAKRDWEVYNSHVVKLQIDYSQVPLKLACQLSHVDMLIFHYSDHKPSAGRHGLEKKYIPLIPNKNLISNLTDCNLCRSLKMIVII